MVAALASTLALVATTGGCGDTRQDAGPGAPTLVASLDLSEFDRGDRVSIVVTSPDGEKARATLSRRNPLEAFVADTVSSVGRWRLVTRTAEGAGCFSNPPARAGVETSIRLIAAGGRGCASSRGEISTPSQLRQEEAELRTATSLRVGWAGTGRGGFDSYVVYLLGPGDGIPSRAVIYRSQMARPRPLFEAKFPGLERGYELVVQGEVCQLERPCKPDISSSFVCERAVRAAVGDKVTALIRMATPRHCRILYTYN